MVHRHVFGPDAQSAFLEEAAAWRWRCVQVLAQAPIRGPVYMATMRIMDGVDNLAEAITEDRARFYYKVHTTPPMGQKLKRC